MTSRVVLGLGGCVDYELRLSRGQLEALARAHHITDADVTDRPGGSSDPVGSADVGAISSERDLVVSILSHLRSGAGGEHYVASPEVLSSFAGRFDPVVAIGGTSVRAGLAMNRLGVPSLLHLVCFNEHFRRLLPTGIEHVVSGYPDALFPHVIVQYDAGVEVRVADIDIRAPFPNRLIYVNDPANERLAISDELGPSLRDCRLLLLSGFNAVRDPDVLEDRLRTVRERLRQLPAGAWVYYEDAAFHRPAYGQLVRGALTDAVDIYGLNEDEMREILRRPVDLLRAKDVAAALVELRAAIPGPVLVVHTKFWAAAVGPGAQRFSAALDEGIAVAVTRFRCGDAFSAADVAQTRTLARRPETTAFAKELADQLGDLVCVRAGIGLTVSEPTTVGLGDTFVGGFLAVLAGQQARWHDAEESGLPA